MKHIAVINITYYISIELKLYIEKVSTMGSTFVLDYLRFSI